MLSNNNTYCRVELCDLKEVITGRSNYAMDVDKYFKTPLMRVVNICELREIADEKSTLLVEISEFDNQNNPYITAGT